jgi:hypothetical protein
MTMSRIVQLAPATTNDSIFALCEDGAVLYWNCWTKTWRKVSESGERAIFETVDERSTQVLRPVLPPYAIEKAAEI